MSIQTNFRAQDMLGTEKPKAKKAAPAPRAAAPAPKVEPVVVEPVAVVEDTVESPAEITTEE
jgi:hypothetical protein